MVLPLLLQMLISAADKPPNSEDSFTVNTDFPAVSLELVHAQSLIQTIARVSSKHCHCLGKKILFPNAK